MPIYAMHSGSYSSRSKPGKPEIAWRWTNGRDGGGRGNHKGLHVRKRRGEGSELWRLTEEGKRVMDEGAARTSLARSMIRRTAFPLDHRAHQRLADVRPRRVETIRLAKANQPSSPRHGRSGRPLS